MMPKTPIIPRQNLTLRHHIRIRRRSPGGRKNFLFKTVAAQIHAIGALLSLIGIVALFFVAERPGDGKTIAALIFGLSCFMLFGSSAFMHFLTDGFRISRRFEGLLELVDKLCIYLLIAGTYTAVLYSNLEEPMRSRSLALVWVVAVIGAIYTIFFDKLPKLLQSRWVSTGQYVAMGWIGVFCIQELVAHLSIAQMVFSLAGGLLYTFGALIYALKRPNFSRYFGYHEIWHFMVALGCLAFVVVVALAL